MAATTIGIATEVVVKSVIISLVWLLHSKSNVLHNFVHCVCQSAQTRWVTVRDGEGLRTVHMS